MKKLTLDLDALAVETFAVGADEETRGTVRGHDFTEATCLCPQPSNKGTCVTCNAPTDPCICDPFHPLESETC